jgi:hypothetical protein
MSVLSVIHRWWYHHMLPHPADRSHLLAGKYTEEYLLSVAECQAGFWCAWWESSYAAFRLVLLYGVQAYVSPQVHGGTQCSVPYVWRGLWLLISWIELLPKLEQLLTLSRWVLFSPVFCEHLECVSVWFHCSFSHSPTMTALFLSVQSTVCTMALYPFANFGCPSHLCYVLCLRRCVYVWTSFLFRPSSPSGSELHVLMTPLSRSSAFCLFFAF